MNKRTKAYCFALYIIALLVVSCNTIEPHIEISSNENPFKTEVDFILELMTLAEKLGQLNLPSSGDITTGQTKSSNVAKKIEEGKVGGLFNIKTVAKIREVQRIAVEKSRLGIPLIFGMDVIHGYKTTFPIPLGLSASWNIEMIEKRARMGLLKPAQKVLTGLFHRWLIYHVECRSIILYTG